jgi:hypothetical protein
MKIYKFLFFIWLALISISSLANTIPYDAFVGTYKFQEKDLIQDTGKIDPEASNQIVLTRTSNGLKGEYSGFLHGGESGLFFFRAAMTDLDMDEVGNFSFELGSRDIYSDPAREHRVKYWSGIKGKCPLEFSGTIAKDEIHLTCVDKLKSCGDCEDSGGMEMVFKRVVLGSRKIFYKTTFKNISEQDRIDIVSDMEYSLSKLERNASACGIQFVHDDSIKSTFLFTKGKESKALDSFGTDVELWEVIEKFYGCSESKPKPH